MLQDTVLAIEYSIIQLVKLSQKGLYDRGRISKHNEFRIHTSIRKEGRKEARKEGRKGGRNRKQAFRATRAPSHGVQGGPVS